MPDTNGTAPSAPSTPTATTGAAVSVTLSGEEYFISPLADRDYDELDYWLQIRAIKLVKDSFDGSESRQLIQEIIGGAQKAALSISLFNDGGVEALTTPAVMGRLLWTMLRKRHHEMKYLDVVSLLRSKENQFIAQVAFDMIHGEDEIVSDSDDSSTGGEGTVKNDSTPLPEAAGQTA